MFSRSKLDAVLFSVLLASFASSARADSVPAPEGPIGADMGDPAFETRLKKLETDLRCLVCQNETLADSTAGLAEDLRREIRAQAKAGKSDDDIREYLHERYGDFVFYKPPVKPVTWALWFGPFALLVFGALWLAQQIRSGQRTPGVATSEADRSRAAALLAGQDLIYASAESESPTSNSGVKPASKPKPGKKKRV